MLGCSYDESADGERRWRTKEHRGAEYRMKIRIIYIDEDVDYRNIFSRYIQERYSDRFVLGVYQSVEELESSGVGFRRDELSGKSGFGKKGGEAGDGFDICLVSSTFSDKLADIGGICQVVFTSDRGELKYNNYIFRYRKPADIVDSMENEYRRKLTECLMTDIRKKVSTSIDLANVTDEQLRRDIDILIQNEQRSVLLGDDGCKRLGQQVFSSIRGLGLLDSLMADDDITEIMINDYDVIFAEKQGRLMRCRDARFESREQMLDIIQKIVGKVGREVNQANPIVDARLDDGSRVNVILPPIALNGPTMTIRRFSKEPMTMERLILLGSITPEVAEKLRLLVRARYNIFISGGTGSGKTTFLNALSDFIPKDERICTIEDSAELQITGVDNLLRLETRNANSSGSGQITIRELIRTALRQRPDRIIVGEVRGAEALDMLQAMNTGHDGSLSTGHANSSRDMLARLETMVLQGAEGFPLEAIKQQIGSSIDIIIHLSRLRDHSRKTMEISEVVGYRNGEIVLNPLYVFREDAASTYSRVSGSLVRTENPLVNTEKLRAEGIASTI